MENKFVEEIREELTGNILPFWMNSMKDPEGGFYGRIDGEGNLHASAEKGAILYGRILWAFSAAYRMLGKQEYLETATRAKNYIKDHFIDPEFGGIYWSLDAEGNCLDSKKQFYAIGFAIYGFSEYCRATGDQGALSTALALYRSIEDHSFDPVDNGYFEAMTRDWQEIEDMRLSVKDRNDKKTMNTHLHILEPYTNLYRVWPDAGLKERILNLLDVFIDKIWNPSTGHLGLFFDEKWNSQDQGFSYGHDIEASWLMMEAAQVIGDQAMIDRLMPVTEKIAEASFEGLQPDGSMIYECHENGIKDEDRHWWVQAETVVGCMWLWKYHGREDGLQKAIKCWDFIREQIIDKENGEWYWSRKADGQANVTDDKAGFWKCPYHNSRMCLEVLSLAR